MIHSFRFLQTYCSQCGGEFGPGNAGFSHCSDHANKEEVSLCGHCYGKGWNDEWKAVSGHHDGGEVFRIECGACAGAGVKA